MHGLYTWKNKHRSLFSRATIFGDNVVYLELAQKYLLKAQSASGKTRKYFANLCQVCLAKEGASPEEIGTTAQKLAKLQTSTGRRRIRAKKNDDQPQNQIANSSNLPSAPGGLVSVSCRWRAASRAPASASGKASSWCARSDHQVPSDVADAGS